MFAIGRDSIILALGLGLGLAGTGTGTPAQSSTATSAAAPATTPASATMPATAPTVSMAELRQIITQLSSDAYAQRQAGTARLAALPDAALWKLAELYRLNDDPEVRRRLRPTIERMFLNQLSARRLGGDGFLGMSFDVLRYPTLPGGESLTSVIVMNVLPGSPAEKGGLRGDDYIMAIDGVTIESLGTREAVADKIAAHRPGEIVRLAVRRDADKLTLRIPVGNKFLDMPEANRQQAQRAELATFWSAIEGSSLPTQPATAPTTAPVPPPS